MKRRLLSLFLLLLLVFNSPFVLSYEIFKNLENHISQIKDFSLDEENLDEYQKLLNSFAYEINNFGDKSNNSLNSDDLKLYTNYRKSFYELNKISQNPQSSLQKIQLAKESFEEQFRNILDEEKSFWQKTYDFLTTPYGGILIVGALIGSAWLLKDYLKSFFYYFSDHENKNPNHSELPEYSDESTEVGDTSQYFLDFNKEVSIENSDPEVREMAKSMIYEILEKGNFVEVTNIVDKNGNTLLMWITRHGFVNLLKMMLNKFKIGEYVNLKNNKGLTASMWAVLYGHADILDILATNSFFKSGIDFQDKQGRTALSLGVMFKKIEAVKALLKGRINIDLKNKQGHTPLMMACMDISRVKIAMELLKYPFLTERSINFYNNDGKTALMLAAEEGNFPVVKEILKVFDVNRWQIFENNKIYKGSSLTLAVQSEDEKVVRELLKNNRYMYGGNGNPMAKKDSRGRTALIHAGRSGRGKIVKMLLNSGHVSKKIFEMKDDSGKTAYLWAAASPKNSSYAYYTLSLTAFLEDKKYLTKEAFKAVDNDGDTALMHVVRKGNTDLILKLFAHEHFDISFLNTQNKRGHTALMMAAGGRLSSEKNYNPDKYKKMVNVLLKKMDRNGFHLKDKQGNSAIMWAAKTGNYGALEALLKSRFKKSIVLIERNDDGKTVFDLAKKGKGQKVQKILELLYEFQEGEI